MNTLYIEDNGLMLKRISNRIILKKDGKVKEEIPLLDLKRILIFGNNQISTELMRHLASKGIEVAFLSTRGKFYFRLVPEMTMNIYLRMAQHQGYHNMGFRVSWSKTIVEAKLKNQRGLLLRFQRNQPRTDIKEEMEIIKDLLSTVKEKETLDELLGVEGYGSKTFFRAYGKMLQGGFTFTKRQYHPPPDPVNALLGFGYMILFNEIKSLLEAFGFELCLGFLHSIKYGRASLATDLIEEFRSPIIDRLVAYLINLGVIKPDQFTKVSEEEVKIDEKARRAYVKNYEKFVTTPFVDNRTRKRTTYRQVIRENVSRCEQMLLHNVDYSPYILYT
jgi:CRISPR-associated protein Cas1